MMSYLSKFGLLTNEGLEFRRFEAVVLQNTLLSLGMHKQLVIQIITHFMIWFCNFK